MKKSLSFLILFLQDRIVVKEIELKIWGGVKSEFGGSNVEGDKIKPAFGRDTAVSSRERIEERERKRLKSRRELTLVEKYGGIRQLSREEEEKKGNKGIRTTNAFKRAFFHLSLISPLYTPQPKMPSFQPRFFSMCC